MKFIMLDIHRKRKLRLQKNEVVGANNKVLTFFIL